MISSKTLKVGLLYDLAVPLLAIYPKNPHRRTVGALLPLPHENNPLPLFSPDGSEGKIVC